MCLAFELTLLQMILLQVSASCKWYLAVQSKYICGELLTHLHYGMSFVYAREIYFIRMEVRLIAKYLKTLALGLDGSFCDYFTYCVESST